MKTLRFSLLVLALFAAPSAWADLCSVNGQVTEQAGTGNQTITIGGCMASLTPVYIIFRAGAATADGSTAAISFSMGIASSSSSGATYGGVATNASATYASVRRYTAATSGKAVSIVNLATTIVSEAAVVSFGTNQVVINWSVNDGTARVLDYYVEGGSDITNVASGQAQAPTSTGTQVITPGFQPDAILFLAFGSTAAPPVNDVSNIRQNIGWSTGTTKNFSLGTIFVETNTNSSEYQDVSHCISILTATNTLDSQAAVSAISSTTFTLNWTTVSDGKYFFWFAIKGGLWGSGSDTLRATTGSQTVTSGVLGTPSGLIIASGGRATTASVNAVAKSSIGFATGASARTSRFNGGTNGVTTSSSGNLDSTKVLNLMTGAGASPTTQTAVDLTSFGSTQFVLNVSATDGAGAEIIYLTHAPTSAPVTSVPRRRVIIF